MRRPGPDNPLQTETVIVLTDEEMGFEPPALPIPLVRLKRRAAKEPRRSPGRLR